MPSSEYNQSLIGIAAEDFLPYGQTVKDTALIDLVNRVQMYYGMAEISAASPLSSTGKISKGAVTAEDINSVYIYKNYMYTITVNGGQLRKYLEYSVSRYYKTYLPGDTRIYKNTSIADYNLDILQGVNYTADLTKDGLFDAKGNLIPAGQPRITALKYNGSEVSDSQIFKLAINSYRFNGGGGFLAAAGIKPQSKDPKAINYVCFDSQKSLGADGGLISSLIIRYFQDMAAGKIIPGKTSVEALCDNNWRTIPRFYDLLHLSDLHGEISNNPMTGTPRINAGLISGAVNYDRYCYGHDRTILLSAGDMIQGEAISNILKGRPVIDIMNQMNFDAMQLGNHEFDWGLDTLNNLIEKSEFSYLAANMKLKPEDTDSKAAIFDKNHKPWIILNKDGLKVGIIGVADPDTINIVPPATIGHFTFQDPVATVNSLVPEVKKAGADIIIVVAHIGDQYNDWLTDGVQPDKAPLEEDLAAFTKKISGVSAVLGGRTHTINYDLIPDATGKLIPAVVGNSSGIAVIRLVLDDSNNIINALPNYLDIYNRLYAAIDPDPSVQAIVDKANEEVGAILNEVIGSTEVDMTSYTTSGINLDSNLGNWATDAIRSSSKADFAFLNYGALRVSIPKGNITVGQIWALMPFDNKISVMDMTGAQIKMILEYMVSDIKPTGHISGLNFNYDPSVPARFSLSSKGLLSEEPLNSRVMWITTADGTPLELEKTYKAAASDFIATGGDYYPFPINSTNTLSTEVLIRDAMIADIRAKKVLNYVPEGRIKLAKLSTYELVTPDLSNIIAGQQVAENLSIKTLAAGNSGYLSARVNISIDKPKGAEVEMLFLSEEGGSYLDAADLGYLGAEDGIVITPSFEWTKGFKLRFSKAGIYTIRYSLVDLTTGEAIAAESSTFTVLNPKPAIDVTLGNSVYKGEKYNFYVNLKANGSTTKDVYLRIIIVNHEQKPGSKLKYRDSKGKYQDLKFDKRGTACYPKEGDFQLEDMGVKFEISFDKVDLFYVKFELVNADNYEVLVSSIGTVRVTDKKK